jgi:murein DD-endopeptidase MepM/ murein hydrolase activator NlpD
MNAHPGPFMMRSPPVLDGRLPGAVDLGNEPPIDIGGVSHPSLDRRGVSLRWLSACILAGSCGAALLGGAIYIAVQGDTSFAERPEMVSGEAPAKSGLTASARKGDKLVAQPTVPTARQVVRAPMSHRVGDKEVIKVRPFVRLVANLSLTSGVYATDIPPFNPLKLFAEGAPSTERYVEPPADVADADVSVVKRELASIQIDDTSSGLGDAEVIGQMDEERANQAAAGRRPSLPIPPQLLLSRTLRQADLAPAGFGYAPTPDVRFSGIDVRVVPENVTSLAKTPLLATREPLVEDRTVLVKRGETFEQLLRGLGANADQTKVISAVLAGKGKPLSLPEGQVMQVMLAPGPQAGDPKQVVRVSLLTEGRVSAIAAVNDKGVFVPVAPPRDEEQRAKPVAEGEEGEEESDSGSGGATLYESLYETGLRHDMPRALIDEMVKVFSYDVDFQRRVSGGDSLEVVYTDGDEGEGSRTEVLFATLSVGGETRRVYRFQSPDDSLIDYFDEGGRSLKKFLLRKPVVNAELRSGFGMRFHPIMRYSKMHTGVDWANGRIGEPILASGSGTVVKAEWDSGYGRRVEIQHANGYQTSYSHMSAFARGIQPGAKVRQGQIIGYIGSSGLSTGPHLHYEVMVNGNFVNPMKIKVPRGRELEGRALAEFKRQREEIDGLIVKAGGTVLAQR